MKKKKSTLLAASLSVGAFAFFSSAGSAQAASLLFPPELVNQLSLAFDAEIQDYITERFGPTGLAPNQGLTFETPANVLFEINPGAPLVNSIVSGTSNMGGPGFTLCNTGGAFSAYCKAVVEDIPFTTDAMGNITSGTVAHLTVLSASDDAMNPFGPEDTVVYTVVIDTTTINDPTGGGSVFKPTDDANPDDGPSLASCQLNPAQDGCAYTFDVSFGGLLTVVDAPDGFEGENGNTVPVTFSYNATRLLVSNPTGDCTEIGDTCTMDLGPTLVSGNVLETAASTNESSNVLALGVLGLLGLFGFKRNSKKGL